MTAARSGRASGIPLSRSGYAENIPPEACFGDALAPIGRQRLSLGFVPPRGRRHGRCGGEMGARCMVRLRILAIRGRAWFHWGMERGKPCLGNARIWEIPARPVREMPDCCNLAASKSVWLRIAAILPFPEEFGSGLPQSCRFPKSLALDCCNPVVSRRVWLRIAAILSFSARNCPDFGKSKKKPAGNGRCFEKKPYL